MQKCIGKFLTPWQLLQECFNVFPTHLLHVLVMFIRGFLGGSAGKESACNAGDLGLIPELGRSPGEGKGYPLQYSGLENSMDSIVYGVAESDTNEWLSLSLCLLGPFLLHLSPSEPAPRQPETISRNTWSGEESRRGAEGWRWPTMPMPSLQALSLKLGAPRGDTFSLEGISLSFGDYIG